MEALRARITANRQKIVRRAPQPMLIQIRPQGSKTAKWGVVDPDPDFINSNTGVLEEAVRNLYIFPTKSVFGAAVTGVKLSTYRQASKMPLVVGKRMTVLPRVSRFGGNYGAIPDISQLYPSRKDRALAERMLRIKTAPAKLVQTPLFYDGNRAIENGANRFNQRGPVLCEHCADAKIASCSRTGEENCAPELSNPYWEEIAGSLMWHQCMSVKPETTVKNLIKTCRFPAIK